MTVRQRWWGHLSVLLAAAFGVQLCTGRVGPVGFGDVAIPLEVLAVGIVVGSLYGLVGVGMVLVWRSHRLLNLAQAQLGAVPAVGALLLVGERGWPYVPAVLLALVGAAAMGAASERLAIRRFDSAPRLAATIATLGLAQVLVAAEILVPRWIAGLDGVARTPETPFSSWRHSVGVVTFGGDHVAAVAVGVGLTVLVAVSLRRTGLGLAVRAVAARPVQAAQLGVPVGRIRAGVWAVAAMASALAVLLRAPLVGFPLGGLVGPGTLLFGLAAATLARFHDPVRALVAGMAVGIVEQGAVFGNGRSTAVDLAILVLIVVSLSVQRGATGRLAEVGAWLPARELPPLPPSLWRDSRVRVLRTIGSGLVAATVVVVPALLSPAQATRMTALCAFGVVAIATVVLTGWSGQLGLGPVGVVGVGAAVTGGLVTGGGAPSDLFVVLVAAAAAGACCSVLVGLPAARLTGPQVAITTLAFAFAVPALILSPGLTGWLLPDGPVSRPVLLGWIDLGPDHRFTYVAVTLLVLSLAVARRLRRSRAGRLLLAGRDDLRVVAGVGMSPLRVRLFSFAVSGALAGVGGALVAWNQGVVEASAFAPQRSLDVVSAVVIGGISSPVGALVGVLWVFGLPMLFPGSPFIAALGSGLGVLVILVAQPGGIGVAAGRAWQRVAAHMAAPASTEAVRGGSAGRVAGVVEALRVAGAAPHPERLIRRLEVEATAEVRDDDPTASDVSGDDGPATRPGATSPPERLRWSGGSGPAMLEIEHLSIRRGPNLVVPDLSLRIERGECVALVGTNGAGKSTVLEAIAGGLRPQRGTISVAGTDVTSADPRDVAALGVAVHPGARACFPDLTVDEHLALAARHLPGGPTTSADELFDLYPRLGERRHLAAASLSGGERHLLGFALASMRAPDLLLVDELSLGLAPRALDELVGALERFRDAGCTIVVVDQRLEHLRGVVDRAVFLERGAIGFDGPVEELSDSGLERPVLSSVPMEIGRGHEPSSHQGHELALELDGVSVSYGTVRALGPVSLQLRAGSVLGIVGGNGAGKTTLLDAISGQVEHVGTVHVAGRDVSSLPASDRAARRLGRTFQAGSGLDALSVRECLALAQDRGMRPRSLTAAALGLPAAAVAETDAVLRAELLAADAGLLEWLDAPAGDLSTGLRRRLELHMVAAHGPIVALLDEPTSGVAAAETPAIGALVRSMAAAGAAVVVVDHDHGFVVSVADDVVELREGRVASIAPAPAPAP